MNSIQSSSYKASLRSKIAVAAAKEIPGDSLDAIKRRMTFTRDMYRIILEKKNIDLFWFAGLTNTNLIHFSVMRKIESQMVAAIYKNKNWCSGNTMVKTDDANISRVFLHGNHIATIDDDSMMIMDGGWQSKTTKSRLNALCDAFCYKGEYVFQKDFKWYVRKCIGAINGENVFKIEDFHSGYTFAWCLSDKNMCQKY